MLLGMGISIYDQLVEICFYTVSGKKGPIVFWP